MKIRLLETLRGRLLLVALLVEAAMLTLLVTNSLRLLRDRMGEQAQRHAVQNAPILRAALVAPLAQYDFATVQAVLDESRGVQGIEYIAVTNSRGQVVAASGWSPEVPLPEAHNEFVIDAGAKKPRYDYAAKIDLGGQTLGTLHFGIDLSPIVLARRELLVQGAFIATGELLLSAVLLTLIGFGITRQLTALTKASKAVAEGSIALSRLPEGHDDIGRLGQAFNRMSQTISERIEEISQERDRARHLAEQADSEQARLSSLLSAMEFGVLFADTNKTIVYVNAAFGALLGTPPQGDWCGESLNDSSLLGHLSSQLKEPEKGPFEINEAGHLDAELSLKDGRTLKLYQRPVLGKDEHSQGQLWIIADVTKERLAEQHLKLAASVFDHSMEAVMVLDSDFRIMSVNPAFLLITGYAEVEVIGQPASILNSDRHGDEFYKNVQDSVLKLGYWQGEIWNRRKSGESYLEWLTINRIEDETGKVSRYVAVFDDITELRSKDERIRHMAYHDAMTGLPNRLLMQDRLQQALERARRGRVGLAVMFMDVDRFKGINDSLGHDVGDALLREVGGRISAVIRSTDMVARLGGDEFVVVMEGVVTPKDCTSFAEKLNAEISRSMDLMGHRVDVSASIGIAVFPQDGQDVTGLMKCADTAMYAAKAAGRNTYRFFQQQMLDDINSRLESEIGLRRAIASGELVLHYQPKVSLSSGDLMGVEALVRWSHSGKGMTLPEKFIPMAEETGLIVELGDWVFEECCRQLTKWQASGNMMKVAINVSARQMEEAGFVERLEDLLKRYRVAPGQLELEITESTVMADRERMQGLLSDLRKVGISIAVDDFGTGYSSLARLSRLPIDVLKVDRSFVEHMEQNREDREVVRTIVALGQTLGLEIVSEGVESIQQAHMLMSLGCKFAQGFYYSKALPAAELDVWMQSQKDKNPKL